MGPRFCLQLSDVSGPALLTVGVSPIQNSLVFFVPGCGWAPALVPAQLPKGAGKRVVAKPAAILAWLGRRTRAGRLGPGVILPQHRAVVVR